MNPEQERNRLDSAPSELSVKPPEEIDPSNLLSTHDLGGLLSTLREIVIQTSDDIKGLNWRTVIDRDLRKILREALSDVECGKNSLGAAHFELTAFYQESEKNFDNHLRSEYEERFGRYRRMFPANRGSLEPQFLILMKLAILENSDFIGSKIVAALTDSDKKSVRYQLATSLLSKLVEDKENDLLLRLIKKLPFADLKGTIPEKLSNELLTHIGSERLVAWIDELHSGVAEEFELAVDSKNAEEIEKLTLHLAGVQALALELFSSLLKKGETTHVSYALLKEIYCGAANKHNRENAKNLIVKYLDPEASQTFHSIAYEQTTSYQLRLQALHDFIDLQGERELRDLALLLDSRNAPFVQYACERLASSQYKEVGSKILAKLAVRQIQNGERPLIFASLLWCGSDSSSCNSALKSVLNELTLNEIERSILILETSSNVEFYEPSTVNRFDNFSSSVEERDFNQIILRLDPITLLRFHEGGGHIAQSAALILQKSICKEDSAEIRRSLVEQLMLKPRALDYLKEIVGMRGINTPKLIASSKERTNDF